MAVAVQMEFDGGTLDQYDEVCKRMGLTPKGPGPAGSISHFATMTDSGLRIVDVWETKEQFEKFAQEQIGPFSHEVGISRRCDAGVRRPPLGHKVTSVSDAQDESNEARVGSKGTATGSEGAHDGARCSEGRPPYLQDTVRE
jgi:hypothetical protein